LERLSGVGEAALERAQRRECAGQRPVEGVGEFLGGERLALFGEQRFDGDVAACR
jgi:hypothetical protein